MLRSYMKKLSINYECKYSKLLSYIIYVQLNMCLMNVVKIDNYIKLPEGQKIIETNSYKSYDKNIDYKTLYMY